MFNGVGRSAGTGRCHGQSGTTSRFRLKRIRKKLYYYTSTKNIVQTTIRSNINKYGAQKISPNFIKV